MLSDRRNCFRGLWTGDDGLRKNVGTHPRPFVFDVDNCNLVLGGPIIVGLGLENDVCCGDSTKHSSREGRGVEPKGGPDNGPLPNLKGGNCVSRAADFMELTKFEFPLRRDRFGLSIVGRLRLVCIS